MNVEWMRETCLSWPGTTEGLKWGEHLCLMVGEKIFVVISLDQTPVAASLKVNEEDFDELVSRDGLGQAPYFQKRQWVKVDDITLLDDKEWKDRLRYAYEQIRLKLTKKLQRELAEQEK